MADEIPGAAGHQRDLSFYQRKGTTGYRSRKLTRIVDTLYFAPSTASRLLQAADLVAYPHHRIQVSGWGTDTRASNANKLLWATFSPRFTTSGCGLPSAQRPPKDSGA